VVELQVKMFQKYNQKTLNNFINIFTLVKMIFSRKPSRNVIASLRFSFPPTNTSKLNLVLNRSAQFRKSSKLIFDEHNS